MNMTGRPTEYSEEILTQARDYLSNYKKFGDEIPSNAGLAVHLGLSRDIIQKWRKEEGKEEFFYILAAIQVKQENVLLNKGLNGDFNSNITKLILGKHGYHEKKDIKANVKQSHLIESREELEKMLKEIDKGMGHE